MHYSSMLPDVIRIADEASAKVLHIYQSDFKVSYKEDESPITAADVASHEMIVEGCVTSARISPFSQKRAPKHRGMSASAGVGSG